MISVGLESVSMKMIMLIIAIGFSNCSRATTNKVEHSSSVSSSQASPVADAIEINFPEVQLVLSDVNPNDFKVSIMGDKAFVQSVGIPQIDGAKLDIKSNKLNGLRAQIQFRIGILQYLTDDHPASPLEFSWKLGRRQIPIKVNQIPIPQFYQNRENVISAFEFLGFTNKQEFESLFEREHFATIKPISYRTQKEQFSKLLAERNRYEHCCPEYIEQANKFLKKRPVDFKTFSDLGLEIVLSGLEIQIGGINSDGKQVNYTITNLRE